MSENKPKSVLAAEYLKRLVEREIESIMDCYVTSVSPDVTSLKLNIEVNVDGHFRQKHEFSWQETFEQIPSNLQNQTHLCQDNQ